MCSCCSGLGCSGGLESCDPRSYDRRLVAPKLFVVFDAISIARLEDASRRELELLYHLDDVLTLPFAEGYGLF